MELTCQKHSLTSASLLPSSGSHDLKRLNRRNQEAAAAKEKISGLASFISDLYETIFQFMLHLVSFTETQRREERVTL